MQTSSTARSEARFEARFEALVVADFGKFYWTRSTEHTLPILATVRHKKDRPMVGDAVLITFSNTSEHEIVAMIEKVLPRRNALYRADETKQKCFAVNIDAVFFVIAPQPAPLLPLLTRAMVAAHNAGIPLSIVQNKTDLVGDGEYEQLIAALHSAGLPVYAVTNEDKAHVCATLLPALTRQTKQENTPQRSLILGQSGVGKSTLINALIPNAAAQTQVLSAATATGKHTTTTTQIYAHQTDTPEPFELIDSPGFQNFGLAHIDPAHYLAAFKGLALGATQCKFYNCTHCHEPNCGIKAIAAKDAAQAVWHDEYLRLVNG